VTTPSVPARRTVKRHPVYQGKTRVPGLWERESASGRVYEFQKRVDGKMRRIKLRATTKTDAINEARGLGVDLDRGDVKIGDRTVTVRALADSFVARERGVLGTRGKRTVDLDEQRLNSHIVPVLGAKTKAAAVSPAQIRKLIDTLKARGLAGSTIRGCVSTASAMFRHGVRDLEAVPRNPCRDLERGDLPSGNRETEPRYLSVEQINVIFDRMTPVFRPAAATCFWAALRISEALRLTWADVDFDAAEIRVPGTKTDASEASVPLLPALARELRAHRERQAALGFDRIRPEALVFQTSSGRSPGRRNALRALQTAAEHAGLVEGDQEPVGLHDLRHSLAANSFALGLTDAEVARLLRHANPRVTTTIYAGLVEGEAAKLGEKLAAGGFGA
jgi:integrase